MGAADAWGGGQVQDALHPGAPALPHKAQSGPTQSRNKTLRRFRPSRRAVGATCSRRSRPLIRAPSGSSAKTKAASGD
jgi:hypothetical protein